MDNAAITINHKHMQALKRLALHPLEGLLRRLVSKYCVVSSEKLEVDKLDSLPLAKGCDLYMFSIVYVYFKRFNDTICRKL